MVAHEIEGNDLIVPTVINRVTFETACPLPSLPLASVLYVLDFPFNLISISKLIHDLNCLITFSHSSMSKMEAPIVKDGGSNYQRWRLQIVNNLATNPPFLLPC